MSKLTITQTRSQIGQTQKHRGTLRALGLGKIGRSVEREDTPDPLTMPLQSMLVAEAQVRINRASHHAGTGAEQLAGYFVGQVVGQMNQVQPARQVVLDMVDEFIDAVQGMGRLLAD